MLGIFPLPPGNFDEQEATIQTRVESDPYARAINDLDAEAFFATAYCLNRLTPVALRWVIGDLPFSVSHLTPAGRRKITLYALKMWAVPAHQRRWAEIRCSVTIRPLPSVEKGAGRITEKQVQAAYEQGMDVVWLADVVRSLGQDVQAMLDNLGPRAQREYAHCLNFARVMMSELHAPTARTRPSATGQADLQRHLKRRESMVRSVRRDIATEERNQREWQQLAHQAEEAQRQEALKARAQATAAQEALTRRLAQHQQELGAIEARHAAEMQRLRERLALAQTDFAAALVERARTTGGTPLAGRRVMVAGRSEDQAGYRLLVESLGGRLVQDGAGLTVYPDSPGLAAFERVLSQLRTESGA